MPSELAVSVQNLTKTYRIFGHPGDRIRQALTFGRKRFHREFTALQDVSFDIRKGETVGIIGRNGSGKSTLLQLICGILKPTSGTLRVNGRIAALLELGAGFNPEFTGRENVFFQGAVMGIPREEMERRFDDIAAFADIGEFLDQPVRTYSSGMFVRLAVAAAIHSDPDILIVDEALAVGDIAFQAKCMTMFRRFCEQGITVVFVSHDMNTIRALCERAIYLEQGHNKATGPASEMAELYLRETRAASRSDAQTNGNSPDAGLRQGTGEVRITRVELLDENDMPCTEAHFGQNARIRLELAFLTPCEVVASYYIRDDKHLILIGSTTALEGHGPVKGNAGERKIVEFFTTLPLMEGAFNILAVLSVPLVPNRSARFVDIVENALVFRMSERSPVKVWSKVYIGNDVVVRDA